MSTTEILARLATLSPEDRALIRDRLDALDDMVMGLSPEERRMVASRVAAHRQNPSDGTTWAVEEEAARSALTPDRIVAEVRGWPADVVAEMVDRLLAASHGVEGEAVDTAWRTEVRRRVSELEAGQVQAVPLEESLANARKLIGR